MLNSQVKIEESKESFRMPEIFDIPSERSTVILDAMQSRLKETGKSLSMIHAAHKVCETDQEFSFAMLAAGNIMAKISRTDPMMELLKALAGG